MTRRWVLSALAVAVLFGGGVGRAAQISQVRAIVRGIRIVGLGPRRYAGHVRRRAHQIQRWLGLCDDLIQLYQIVRVLE